MAPGGLLPQRDPLNFKVLKFLGKGSYGSVFQVQRLSDGQEYALKEMDARSMNQAEREDAANEIRLLASVDHPNVIAYNEAFLDGNRLCIIMEYAPDGDMAKVIKKHQASKRPMPEDLIWKYFIQVARGLQALHNMKILHRDIKPGNIMIMKGDVAKIGDLGISKLLKHTMAKTQIGTPHYMPPEVWKSRPYSFTSDTWALGCILYEMATFGVPFEAKSMSELRYKVLRGSYPPMSSSYSRDLHQMVKDCMNQNPDRRPTMDMILNSDPVLARLHLMPSEARQGPPSTAQSVMLNTIKVPKNLQLLKGKLPGPVYPGMSGLSEEDETDSVFWHPPPALADKLPQIGGGGGMRPPPAVASPMMQRPLPTVATPPMILPSPHLPHHQQPKSAAVKSVYAIAQNYGLPLPLLNYNPRANNDGDYAGLELAYGKPKQPPPVQTHAMREQQLRLAAAAAAPRWPPQVQKAGVSESHSAYGSFYQAPVMAQGGQPSNGYPGQAGVVLPAVSNVYVSRVNAGSPAKLPPIAPASQAGRAEQSPARAGGQQRYPGQWVAPKGSRWW